MSIILEHPDDDRFTIENVEPLIVDVTMRGEELEFLFRCPVSGFEVSRSIRPEIHLGHREGSLGRNLSDVMDQAKQSQAQGASPRKVVFDPSVTEIEEAACDAFELVSQDFLWDGMRWTYWEAEDRVVDFLELADHLDSIDSAKRQVVSQVLSCVVWADGKSPSSSKQMLSTLWEEAPTTPSPTFWEAGLLRGWDRLKVSALVAFAYALASADGELSQKEIDVIDKICVDGALGPLRQWELRQIGIAFVLDDAFSRAYEAGGGKIKTAEIYALAINLGFTRDKVKDIEWRFLKRSGFA